MQQGDESQRHSFQVRSRMRVIPLLCNGSSRSGLLLWFRDGGKSPPTQPPWVRPFNSKVHSASALLPCSHHVCPALWKSLWSVLVLVSVFVDYWSVLYAKVGN